MEHEKKQFLSIDTDQIKSLRDIAVGKLRDAIIAGHYQPGEQLKERELSNLMGISTTPIKEALRILSHEGLVETIPRKGTFISEVANSSIEEVLILRSRIEGVCARLAAEKITENELSELEETVNLMESLKGKDHDRLAEVNTKFHTIIRKAAKNPMIFNILVNISSFDEAMRKQALKYDVEVYEGFLEHKEIFNAIKSRNPELAENRMIEHITNFGKRYKRERRN